MTLNNNLNIQNKTMNSYEKSDKSNSSSTLWILNTKRSTATPVLL